MRDKAAKNKLRYHQVWRDMKWLNKQGDILIINTQFGIYNSNSYLYPRQKLWNDISDLRKRGGGIIITKSLTGQTGRRNK